MTESVEQAATSAGWKARAEREAAAILDGYGLVAAFNRDTLIGLLAVAWLQGTIYGSHETLAHAEQAFDRIRETL